MIIYQSTGKINNCQHEIQNTKALQYGWTLIWIQFSLTNSEEIYGWCKLKRQAVAYCKFYTLIITSMIAVFSIAVIEIRFINVSANEITNLNYKLQIP